MPMDPLPPETGGHDDSAEAFLLYRDDAGRQQVVALGPAQSLRTIGRGADNDVALGWDTQVSRLHAQLEWIDRDWVLVDDGLSRNGTYVNGERLAGRRRLCEGDIVLVGATSMAYRTNRSGLSSITAVAGDVAAAAAGPESAPASETPPGSPLEHAETLNGLAKIVLAVVPALTVALAAVGGATGGLARLFRDQTGAARAAVALIFLSFVLAALATRTAAATSSGARATSSGRRIGVKAALLLVSTALFVAGVGWAFDRQISVMGRGQAPLVTGLVKPGPAGESLDAHVLATGVKSSRRVVVFAFQSSDEHGDRNSRKLPLYYSKSGPDADGRVDIAVLADVRDADATQYPYVFVTAVLGEEQRDCEGVLLEGTGPPRPTETACMTLRKSAGGSAAAARALDVPGSVAWREAG
jgi:hypothetical protein